MPGPTPAPRRVTPAPQRVAVAMLLAAAVVAGVGAPAHGRQLPEPVVVTDGAATGELRIEPAVAEVPPGTVQELRLANGGDVDLELALRAVATAANTQGEPTPYDEDPPADVTVVLPTDRVVLAAGEVATFGVAVAERSSSKIVAVQATSVDTEPVVEVASLLVVGEGGTIDDIAADLDPAGEASVRLDVSQALATDVRVRVRTWTGVLADRSFTPLAIPPEGRELRVGFERPPLPGTVTLEVVAAQPEGAPVSYTTTTMVWPDRLQWLLLGAAVSILVGAVVLALRRRRARHTDPPPKASGHP